MIRRDYILAIIAELIQAIARAIGLFRAGESQKADSIIDACYRLLKIDRAIISTIPPDGMIPHLLECYTMDTELLETTADLYCAEAEDPQVDQLHRLESAIAIYTFLDQTDGNYSLPRFQKLSEANAARTAILRCRMEQ